MTDKFDEKIRKYMKEKFNKDIDDKELLECRQSFYYLGRAIYRYQLLKLGLIKSEKS